MGEQEHKAAADSAASATKTIIGINCVGIGLALFLGWILSRVIGTPLASMQHAAEQLAAGDVDVQIDLDTNDEMGALARAFRTMAEVTRERADLAATDRRRQRVGRGDCKVRQGSPR
ncbi:MAG: HAMP domain-containing protein [Paludibaculum sp.]